MNEKKTLKQSEKLHLSTNGKKEVARWLEQKSIETDNKTTTKVIEWLLEETQK